ncbi:MAG: hypothetical protein N3H31_00715 [Candidatus Nezhaarchaeota archaeon]|nr:hypothetical protein [Candidatus Nezhaarchaeota archaeon]
MSGGPKVTEETMWKVAFRKRLAAFSLKDCPYSEKAQRREARMSLKEIN